MKVVLVGLGEFGYDWYMRLKRDYREQLRVVVVDQNSQRQAKLEAGDPFYASLADALERERPDFVLNATPPAIHGLINQQAFDQRVPVLCEKPISDDYGEAVQMVERAVRDHIPFAIAENYRFAPSARQVKALIDQDVIGEPAAIRVDFYRNYRTEKGYFVNMDNPLLVDVTIHHFDLVRYFTGAEGKRLFAQSYRPPGSDHRGNMALDFWLAMESGCVVNYHGTLAARAAETTWIGDWRIEGTRGAIQLTQDRVDVIQNGRVTAMELMRDVRPPTCLDEFILSLAEQRPAETNAVDYLRTQALVHFAQQSQRQGRLVEVEHCGPGENT